MSRLLSSFYGPPPAPVARLHEEGDWFDGLDDYIPDYFKPDPVEPEQPSIDKQYHDCINSGNTWCGSFCAPEGTNCGGNCPPDFVTLYDNNGQPIDCIHVRAGQECFIDKGSGYKSAGTINDDGECVKNDTSHIDTQQEATDYCQTVYGQDAIGYLDENGQFDGCCRGGKQKNADGDCECPAGNVWNESEQICQPGGPGGGTDTPTTTVEKPRPARPNCAATYDQNHYAIFVPDLNDWRCFECRSDERGADDGYCYCKPGTTREVPGDVNSACVPVGSAEKPTSEKAEGSIWPWVVGGVLLAGLGVAAYAYSQSGEPGEGEGMPEDGSLAPA